MASLVSRQSSALSVKSASGNRIPVTLPNLPGTKRNPPPPARVFKDRGLQDIQSVGSLYDEPTSQSFFAEMDAFEEASVAVMSYPSRAESYNDTGGRYSLRSQMRDRETKSRSLPFNTLDSVPSFVVDDRRVCRFIAIFEEFVPVNTTAPVRTRKVHISYYLEDNTMEIIEPHEPNTGLMQGKILRRHQVVKPTAEDQSPEISIYMINDFSSGSEITIYNRIYTVVDCDERTRKILNEVGLEFGDSLPLPSNYYDPSASRSSLMSGPHKTSEVFSQTGRAATSESKSFFRNDGEVVLRFYAVWDDRHNMFGILNKLRIHFYVNDNTMEILQDFDSNDGRDRVPKLIKRMRVLKTEPDPALIETSLTYTMEQIRDEDSTYNWTDFEIGAFITVIGVKVQILDADAFTRSFYEKNRRPLGPGRSIESVPEKKAERIIPPHNGFGSEEDSLQTCTGRLITSPIRKDITKAKLYAGQVLRFEAKILNAKGADRSRQFVFQWHLEDDTIQIREPPVTNSGFKGGRFMARERIKRPDGNYISRQDVMTGTVITVHSYDFLLGDADEFTHKFMESRPDIWPECSLTRIRRKLQDHESDVCRTLLTSPGNPSRDATYGDLERLLTVRCGINFSVQELITLQRGLDPEKKGRFKFSRLISLINDENFNL